MIKGLHFVPVKKQGVVIAYYVYAYRGGPRILKSDGPAKPKLDRATLTKLLEAIPDKDAGTLGQLIRQWRRSPEWKGLAQSTRDTWGFALDAIEAKWAPTPLHFWNDHRMISKVVAWRDSRADTPRAADIGVTVLGELLKFGKIRALVRINVAADVPAIYKGSDRAEIIWTQDDIDAYHAAADGEKGRGQAVKDILDLACCTGLRRADLAGITWAEVGDNAIVRKALKKSRGRRRRAVIPLTPQSREVLERLRGRQRADGVDTLLVSSKGTPWTPGSLTQAFNETRNAAGIVHRDEDGERSKHLHDCRGTFVTHLCLARLTNEEIANIVAWSPENVDRVRRIYVDDAAVVVALAERIASAAVKRSVK
jgi:integrase